MIAPGGRDVADATPDRSDLPIHLPRLRRATTVLLTVAVVLPLTVSATAQDLEEVEAEVDALTAQLEAATQAWEETRANVETTEYELTALESRAVELEAEAADADAVITDQIRSMYKFGQDPVFESLVTSDGPQGAIERASLMAALNGRQRARFEQATALRDQLEQTQALIADRAAELDVLMAQLGEQRDVIDAQLVSRTALAVDLRQRAERQRVIDRGVQQGIYACIHDSNHFSNSWGNPRSGGRSHKGVDVMAPYNVPVYAFTNGRITRMNSGGLGGIQLYLWGDDGNEYFYAHLSGYADSSYVGKRVEAGELIGYNGDTGNARGTPHVHFEVHPGGGSAVNPYQWMASACF